LDKYVFSEPQVTLTHTDAIEVVGWLPDGERLLIIRRIPKTSRETIELYNTTTGESQWYAERLSLSSKPIWLAAQQAVAFMDATREEGWTLRLSYGEKQPVETLHAHLASPYLAADPAGQQVSILLRDQGARPAMVSLPEKATRSLDVRLAVKSWLTTPDAPIGFEETYQLTWSPKGKWLACHSMDGFYLLEVATGQICLVDLGDCPLGGPPGKCWALDAQWSPDERYLAMLTMAGKLPVDFIGLTLLDTHTGEYRRFDLGLQVLYTITWAPNSRDLLVVAKAGTDEKGIHRDSLYILDANVGNTRQILIDQRFIGTGSWGVAWSPNGQTIALVRLTLMPTEPTIAESHLCIVAVEVR